MTAKVNADLYKDYISVLKRIKIGNANQISKILGVKYDTSKAILIKMVDDGLVFYEDIKGQGRCYTLMPNWNECVVSSRQVKIVPKLERLNVPYVRASCNVVRARTVDDIQTIPGFVCHPNVHGNNIPRLVFVRPHINGEYQVPILTVGDMKTTQWVDKIRIRWKKSNLNGNVSCNGSLFFPDEREPYKVRTVSKRDGTFTLLSVKVHPRYIYYEDADAVCEEEFKLQVADVLHILSLVGWSFGDTITIKGEKHIAYAGSDGLQAHLSPCYERSQDDDLWGDKSTGNGEIEHIGSNPETDYIIANLPTIIKNQTTAIYQLSEQIAQLTANQANTIKLIMGAGQTTNFSNDGGMYG